MASDPKEPGPSDPFGKLADISVKHLAAVGLIASSWAGFELAIDQAALGLARIPQNVGICFTAQSAGSARKFDAYIAVARLKGAESFAGELDKFAKAVASVAERRNRVVHDPWFIITADGKPHRYEATARRKLRSEYIHVTREEMEKLVNDNR
jgi:hypothetical protein